jgi:hypothetical protein
MNKELNFRRKRRQPKQKRIQMPQAKSGIHDLRMLLLAIDAALVTHMWPREDMHAECFVSGSGSSLLSLKIFFDDIPHRSDCLPQKEINLAHDEAINIVQPFGATIRRGYSESNWVKISIVPFGTIVTDTVNKNKPPELEQADE